MKWRKKNIHRIRYTNGLYMKLIQFWVKFMEAGILFYMLQNLVPPRQTQNVTTLHVDVYLAAGAIYTKIHAFWNVKIWENLVICFYIEIKKTFQQIFARSWNEKNNLADDMENCKKKKKSFQHKSLSSHINFINATINVFLYATVKFV
jgi:hypothetical protein